MRRRCCARATRIGTILVVRVEVQPVHRAADRAAGDVRGPGRHRHRERPAVRGAAGAHAELSESVEELRALGEVGQAVSSSLDLQEVLTTIVAHAARLVRRRRRHDLRARRATGEFVHFARPTGMPDELVDGRSGNSPLRLGTTTRRAGQRRHARPVQIADIWLERDRRRSRAAPDALLRAGFRALLAVPLAARGARGRRRS